MSPLRRFIAYYKPHRRLFILDMVCAFVVAFCDLYYPVLTKNIINDYIPNRNLSMLITFCMVLLGIYMIKALLNFVIQYWGHVMGVRIQADMRRDVFEHLQTLPFTYFDETKTGTIISRITNDLFEISELAHHCPEDLFISVVTLAGSFVMLSRIDFVLTLIVFAVLPIVIIYSVIMRKRMSAAFKLSRERIAEINANVEASVSGIRVAKSYTAESHENKRFSEANELFKKARNQAYKAMGQFHSGMTFFTDFLYLAVLFAGGLFRYYGKIDNGELVAYLLYVTMFLNPVKRLIGFFEQLQDGLTGLSRFCEIMDVESEKDDENAEILKTEELKGEITFNNVSFAYRPRENDTSSDGKMVINDLTLGIPEGKCLALVGPSGGGKTTLCHLIPRFYELRSGSICIDGKDIRSYTRRSLRENIGIVQQDVFLFNGTIRENIEYGRLGASDEEIIDAAKRANIHDFIMGLEHGYDTNVGERGVKLSGGQKQRISIARVFLKNPSILILDEATSALDNETEVQIQASLEDLMRGRTSIVVAHRLSTIRHADIIAVLTKNGVEEKGTHAELMKKKGIYSRLYSYQLKE